MNLNFLGYKLILKTPAKYDLVLIDQINFNVDKWVIPENFSVFVLKVREKEFYLSLKILFIYFKNLKNFLPDKLFFLSLKELLQNLKNFYKIAIIETANPKVIISSIDNSGFIHWISKNYLLCPVIVIQNGLRLRHYSKESQSYFLQHFFCWGKHESKFFQKNNYKVNNFYPSGSLKASLFLKKKKYKKQFDLLVVSCWRGNIGLTKDFINSMSVMKKMDIFLSKYIRDNDLKAAIILRTEENSQHYFIKGYGTEYEYFKNIYGNSVKIIKNNLIKGKVYKLMQKSELSVSLFSSALLEIYGAKYKIMYLNFFKNQFYHCDFDKKIVLNYKNYKTAANKLNKLIFKPNSLYIKHHKKYMQYLMSYPSNKSTALLIREKIIQIIKNK